MKKFDSSTAPFKLHLAVFFLVLTFFSTVARAEIKQSSFSPVLLVHGINDTANGAWGNGAFWNLTDMPGLQSFLEDKGFNVFTVDFPTETGSNNEDIRKEAYYLATKIDKIKDMVQQVLGQRPEKVSLVCHSMGGLVAKWYVTSKGRTDPINNDGGVDYRRRRDVDRIIMIATPNHGQDFRYRHPMKASVVTRFFGKPPISPAERQMLFPQDPLPYFTVGQELFDALFPNYEVVMNVDIDKSLIPYFLERQLPEDVPLFSIIGTANAFFGSPIEGENHAESDGVVLSSSAHILEAVEERKVERNHPDILRDPQTKKIVFDMLRAQPQPFIKPKITDLHFSYSSPTQVTITGQVEGKRDEIREVEIIRNSQFDKALKIPLGSDGSFSTSVDLEPNSEAIISAVAMLPNGERLITSEKVDSGYFLAMVGLKEDISIGPDREQMTGSERIAYFEQETARSQADLRRFLEEKKKTGEVGSYNPFWSVNVIAVSATKGTLKEIAARSDVKLVQESRRHYILLGNAKTSEKPSDIGLKIKQPQENHVLGSHPEVIWEVSEKSPAQYFRVSVLSEPSSKEGAVVAKSPLLPRISSSLQSWKVPQTLPESIYWVQVWGFDEFGSELMSSIAPFGVDLTPPSITSAVLREEKDIKLRVSISDPLSQKAHDVRVVLKRLPGEEVVSTIYTATEVELGASTISLTDVADGKYFVEISATDDLGNVAVHRSDTIIVDKTPPTVSVTQSVPAFSPNGDGRFDVLQYTLNPSEPAEVSFKQQSPSGEMLFSAHARGTPQNPLAIQWYQGRMVLFRWEPNGSPRWIEVTSKEIPRVVPDGSYPFEVSAVDEVGNTSGVVTGSIQVDITPPTLKNFSLTPLNFSPNGDGIKDEAALSFELSEPAETELIIYTPSGERVFEKILGNGQTFTWTGQSSIGSAQKVPDGTYNIKLISRDVVGNETVFLPSQVVVDTTPPLVRWQKMTEPLFAKKTEFQVDFSEKVDWILAVDGIGEIAKGSSDVIRYPWEARNLKSGIYTWRIQASDGSGNALSPSFSSTFEIDRTPPVISEDQLIKPNTLFVDPDILVSWMGASDPHPGYLAVEIRRLQKGGDPLPIFSKNFQWGAGWTKFPEPVFGGKYEFGIRAVDQLGNTSHLDIPFEIDSIPPKITVLEFGGKPDPSDKKLRTYRFSLHDVESETLKYFKVAIHKISGEYLTRKMIEDKMRESPKEIRIDWDGSDPLDPTVKLPDGNYRLAIEARDLIGNRATFYSSTIVVDNTPPQLTLTQLSPYTKFSPNGDGRRETIEWSLISNEKSEATVQIIAASSEVTVSQGSFNLPSGTAYKLMLGASDVNVYDQAKNQLTKTIQADLTDGAYGLVVTAEDDFGNRSEPLAKAFARDTHPPDVRIVLLSSNNKFSPNRDGRKDTIEHMFYATETGKVLFNVKKSNGESFASFAVDVEKDGRYKLDWGLDGFILYRQTVTGQFVAQQEGKILIYRP